MDDLLFPIPIGLIATGASMAAKAALEACADVANEAVAEGVKEGFLECQREALSSLEAAAERQIAPVAAGLESLASAISDLSRKPPTSQRQQ